MFTETYLESQDVGTDLIRKLLSTLDRPVFALLGVIYQLFFNVASADILSAGVSKFYQRVQLIIGVFMMFQLAMTIIKGIINPDNFTDSKSGGGSIIFRICTALVMLALIVPINISSASNEYEKQINNNGLLFGTLYSLQHRILANNTIGRLVMGVRENDNNYLESNNQNELKKSADIFTSTILKGFYRINLIPEKERVTKKGQEADQILENRMCQDIDNDIIKEYSKIDSDPGVIISAVNETCEPEFNFRNHIPGVSSFFGTKKYAFTYMPVVSFIIGIIFVVILLSFTIDIAVRTVKLAVLRLIAPIPIISYMDPKGSKDGSFNAWVKALTSTYLDLFIRIAAVYFVIFIIQEMIVNGVVVSNATGIIGVFTWILIWVGLFYFAKEAPKFIREVLGLKGEGTSLFSGFGKIMGLGAVGAGALGGGISRAAANWDSTDSLGKNLARGAGNLGIGTIGGGVNAGKEWYKQKGVDSKAIMSKVRANNERNYANAADESTAFGRFAAGFRSNVGLKNKAQQMDDKIKAYESSTAAWKRINKALDSDGTAFAYTGPTVQDSQGNVLFQQGAQYSVKDAKDTLDRMRQSGQYSQSELEAMENAHKHMQEEKFDTVRRTGEHNLRTLGKLDLYGTEAQIFQGAESIYKVGKKYADDEDEVFKDYQNATSVADAILGMGKQFKGASYNAERQADAVKTSPEYAQAQANAKRAEQANKK